MAGMKDEAAAYITAINIKEAFFKGVSPDDFHPDHLANARQRLTKARDDLEGCCEKIHAEELLGEFDETRKNMKSYLAVLTNLAELEQQHPELWPALRYWLAPLEAVEERPFRAALEESRKILDRIGNFSALSRPLIEKNYARREEFEREQERRRKELAKKVQPPKSDPVSRFFNKLMGGR